MAIRESIRRALRRSDNSDSSQPEGASPMNSTTSTSKTSVSSKSSANRLTRTWTWGSNKEKEPVKERKPKNKTKKRLHPSERPLTEQNLRHQEMLSHFTFAFGASRPDQIEDLDFIGISPCCTRAPSLADYDPNGDSDGSTSSQDSQLSQPFPDEEGGR